MRRAVVRTALLASLPGTTVFAQASPTSQKSQAVAPAMTVAASGAPRTVQFARATVPPGIPGATGVRYTIVPTGEAPLVTRQLAGTLPPGGEGRGVLVSFSIPSRALAGTLPVATVTYTTADGRAASTAVEARVTAVRAISLTVLQAVRGARPGETLDITYRVSNLGNVADSARLAIQLPYGWATRDRRDTVTVVIPPGSAVEQTARVVVGKTASTGSYTLRLTTHLGAKEVAADNAFVAVVTPRDGLNTGGPVLTTSVLTATGSGGGRSVLTALSLRGRIAGDVGIIADAHQHTTLDETNRYRLSTLGQFPQPPTITLFNPQFRGTLGAVGANFSDITGINAGGRGAGFSYDGERRGVQVFGASAMRSGTDAADSAGTLVGARIAQRVGPLWITGTAAHLEEGTLLGRQLDVVGAGVIVPSALGNGDVTAEMAWRRHRDGEGLGLLAQYALAEQFTRVQLRAMTAPGGSGAFAQSRAGLFGVATHRFSPRLTVGTFGSIDTDESSYRGTLHNHGLSVTPRIQVTDRIFVAPEVATTSQRTRTASLAFGQTEHRTGLQAGVQVGNFALMAGAGGSRVTRDAQADTLPVATTSMLRTRLTTGISFATLRFGALSVLADVTEDQTNASAFPRQNQVGFRIDRLPLYAPGSVRIFTNGAVQRMGWYGERPGVLQLRGDVTAELPFGFNIALAADHNPLVTLPGGGAWSTSIRAERRTALRLPAIMQTGQHRGVVYRDVDGNGRRGPNEPGAVGIVVQRGGDVVSTDAQGRFRLPRANAPVTGSIQVDPRSLPAGWIQSGMPTATDATRALRDIPIVPTTHVRVHLSVSREDLGASGRLDLRTILVIARDSLGRAWLATPDTTSDMQGFPALPPGLYALEVDPGGAGLSLIVREIPPPFRVGADRDARTIRVELATRRVRMFRQPDAPSIVPDSPTNPAPRPVPTPVPTPVPAKRPAPTIPRSGKEPPRPAGPSAAAASALSTPGTP